jgi:hypothetical protein
MDLAEGSVSDPQMLVAGADGGRLIVMLPPQHVGETPGRGFGDAVAQPARIAGPSQLGFDIPAGRTVRLTAEGVLEAMYTLVAAPADFTGTVADETAIEMPWGLLMSVDTPANDETTHAQHVKAPRASPAGAVELWHTLIVRSGSAPSSTEKGAIDSWDARLRLRPISHWQDPPPREAEQAFRPPLTGDQRAQIVQNGRLSAGVTSEPVMADRMMLSALGGWLNAEGTWPTFEWEHEAVCGRDMRVRTVRHGMLYPLGHRADYVELTERQIDPMDAPDHFLEGALLSKTGTLFIREAVHQYPAEVSPEFREFPFWEVEIATPAVTDLDPPVWERDRRSVGMGSIAEEVARLSIQIDMEEKDPENKRRLEERRAELWKLKDQLERDYGSDFDVFFLPTIGGKPVLLPVTLRGAGGDVLVRMAQIFVAEEVRAEEERPVGLAEPIILGAYNSFTEPGIRKRLHAAYERTPPVELAGLPVALAGTHRFEVHAFRTEASATGSSAAAAGFRPRISEATIELPAVRKLASSPSRHAVVFTKAYKTSGQTDAVFEPVAESGQIDVAFAGSDHAGGLATPSFVANAISGIGAPVSAADIEPSDFFKDGANLLGIVPLAEVVRGDPKKRPSITSVRQAAGLPPSVSLLWEDVILKSQGPFQTIDDRSRLTLKVESSVADGGPPGVTTSGTLTLFKLEFAGVLVVSFDQLKFESRPNAKPSLTVAGFALEFEGDLSFLTVLRDAVAAIAQDIPAAIDAKPSEVTISQSIALPTTSFGVGLFAVTVRDAVFQTTVRLPFNGPVAVDFSFGSRKHPFLLGVWILGGGGYLELEIRAGEIERVSASVEVGGLWSLDWVVVSGEVHALAGIEIHLENRSAKLSGYLRVGGSVEALGLVSVSLELTAAIEAGSTGPNEAFQVRATGSVVIEIDLFLLSTDLRLEKTIVIYTASATGDARLRVTAADADAAPVAAFLAALAAPDAAEPVSLDDARNAWMEYRAAFAA